MEAVNGNRFGRWLGVPSRAGSSDRGSGPERELWCLGWEEHPAPLAPSASPGNLSLSVSEDPVTGHLQLNLYGYLSFCDSEKPRFCCMCLFLSFFFYLFFFFTPLTSYSLDIGPNKYIYNLIFLTCVLVDFTQNETCSFVASPPLFTFP